MDPIARAALSSWDWRPEVIITIVTLGALFVIGWVRLRRISGGAKGARSLGAAWRPVVYISGLLVIGLALLSPIDVLVQHLFFVHMIQHLLLIQLAPFLLLLPNPMPFILWGLPARGRRVAGRMLNNVLHKESTAGQILRKLTSPALVWFIMFVFIIGWHDPNLYNLALRSEFVHDIEHITMFVAGMLFWWVVIGSGPRLHKSMSHSAKIVFVLAAIPPSMALGVVLAFNQTVIYEFYSDMPRLWGISALDDQRLSGVIMWVPGGMMHIVVILGLLYQMLSVEERKPTQVDKPWHSDEVLAAPGAAVGTGHGSSV